MKRFDRGAMVVHEIELQVNGETRRVAAGTTLAELLAEVLAQLGQDERQVAVERNRQIVRRAQYAETRLEPGDRLEIVTFVGGG